VSGYKIESNPTSRREFHERAFELCGNELRKNSHGGPRQFHASLKADPAKLKGSLRTLVASAPLNMRLPAVEAPKVAPSPISSANASADSGCSIISRSRAGDFTRLPARAPIRKRGEAGPASRATVARRFCNVDAHGRARRRASRSAHNCPTPARPIRERIRCGCGVCRTGIHARSRPEPRLSLKPSTTFTNLSDKSLK
jgi:hypothetical protein